MEILAIQMKQQTRMFDPVFLPGDLSVEGFTTPPSEEKPEGQGIIVMRFSSGMGVSYAYLPVEQIDAFEAVLEKLKGELASANTPTAKLIVPGISSEAVEAIRKDLNGKGGA